MLSSTSKLNKTNMNTKMKNPNTQLYKKRCKELKELGDDLKANNYYADGPMDDTNESRYNSIIQTMDRIKRDFERRKELLEKESEMLNTDGRIEDDRNIKIRLMQVRRDILSIKNNK
jgi:hypothetical protein